MEEPSQDFYCPVTFGLLLQPHCTSCCRQNLSVEAVNRLQREKTKCPLCREPKWSIELNKEFEREVQRLRVFCPHVDRGCKWEGQLKMFDRHVRSCLMSYPLESTGFVDMSKKLDIDIALSMSSLVPRLSFSMNTFLCISLVWGERERAWVQG